MSHLCHVPRRCFFAQASQHVQELEARLTARLARLCTGNVLRAWRAVVRQCTLDAVRMGRCQKRVSRKLLERALLHWADLAAERKAFLTSLRVCLKRQKVAFSLFKNWCVWVWDSMQSTTVSTQLCSSPKNLQPAGLRIPTGHSRK